MPNDKEVRAWLHPLVFPSIGELPRWLVDQPIEPSFLVQDLSQDFGSGYLEDIRKRYWSLTTPEFDIPLVPNEKKILEKLVWPLRTAKQAFILGNYVGCIALCGMVSEMATIFLFDLIAIQAIGKPLSAERQKRAFGCTFEKLGQEKRIECLREMKFIGEDFVKEAECVRKTRRQYLHFLSKSYSRIEEDASEAYKASFRLVRALVNLPVADNGSFSVPTHLVKYLNDKLNK